MNLIVDIGNSRSKVALFQGDKLVKETVLDELTKGHIQQFCEDHSFERSILSSVKKDTQAIEDFLKSKGPFIYFDEHTPIPIQNQYETPATLGNDRLVAAVEANALFPGKAVLVVDAGTSITYEFLTAEGHYLGGGISLGLAMRFKALNTFTDQLPLVKQQEYELIGKTTEGAILSGVLAGTVAEVQGIITQYQQQYPEVQVVLTGGDHEFFEKALKNGIFAEPFLVLKGLNRILSFNE